ncbi:Uncharacterised protein [Amycolatopsis camponoti]|uniref:Uncharacterized protein n=1 Tax=Amycolatopsis camponoti TaxID=2606593 RepID=A0A6I8MA56_9PSEU|nr:Uncharacterised protein [Amycolatopsis camponoti]
MIEVRKPSQEEESTARCGPEGSFESRTATAGVAKATSTQAVFSPWL